MSFADKSDSEVTSFDDVDLLEAENAATDDGGTCINNLADVAADRPCTVRTDDADEDFMQSKTDTDFISTPRKTDLVEDGKHTGEDSSCLSTEIVESSDSVITDQSLSVTAENVSTSSHHSPSLSSEVVSLDGEALLPGRVAGDGCLETSTAVLSLDSDVDSPQRQRTVCDLTNGDEIEVNVAALQRQINQLTHKCDEYKSLYSQSKDEIDNYQEQILQVQKHHYNTPAVQNTKLFFHYLSPHVQVSQSQVVLPPCFHISYKICFFKHSQKFAFEDLRPGLSWVTLENWLVKQQWKIVVVAATALIVIE